MTHKVGYKVTARTVRSDARAKLAELRQMRVARKQKYEKGPFDDPVSESSDDALPVMDPLKDVFADGDSISSVVCDVMDTPDLSSYLSEQCDATDVAVEGDQTSDLSCVEETNEPTGSRAFIETAEAVAIAEMDAVDPVAPHTESPARSMYDTADIAIAVSETPNHHEEFVEGFSDAASSISQTICSFRSKRKVAASNQLEPSNFTEQSGGGQEVGDMPVAQDSDALEILPGIGPGLIWMFNECGVHSMSDLASVDHIKFKNDLGLIAQIVNLDPWIDFAKSRTAEIMPSVRTTDQ